MTVANDGRDGLHQIMEQSPDGTGLGLSIAKWIVDQHQGTIEVTSMPEQGTEFHIRFPLIRP